MADEGESEWSIIASKHADRVDQDIEYYRSQSGRCGRWHRRLQILALVLASTTTVIISLATAWKNSPTGELLQILSIIIAGTVSLVEGLARVFAFDRRWASSYLAIWALTRARMEYKMKRIGRTGEDWQKVFINYVNRYFDIIGKENSEFFSMIQQVDQASRRNSGQN